jgi:hypothetical protein
MINNSKNYSSTSVPDIDFIEEQIKALSPEDRAALLSRLALSATIVFSASSVVSSGSAVQINNGSQDLNNLLDKIPPEALGEFLKAIGTYIVNHKA